MALLTYGSIYFSTPTETTMVDNVAIKAAGTTTTMQLAGFLHTADNQLICDTATERMYEVRFDGSVTKLASGTTQTDYYIYKGGLLIPGAAIGRTISSASDEGAFPLSAQVSLVLGEYVELWFKTDGDDLKIESGVLSAKVIG